MKMKYKILKADSVEELEELVNKHMKMFPPYRPLGGVSVRMTQSPPYESKTEFVQAMTCSSLP
jgi:hypothetical protein